MEASATQTGDYLSSETGLWVVLSSAVVIARARGNAHGLGFAVDLSSAPTADELDHALSALSVACDTCGRELEALKEDPDLARVFLATRHPQIAIPK